MTKTTEKLRRFQPPAQSLPGSAGRIALTSKISEPAGLCIIKKPETSSLSNPAGERANRGMLTAEIVPRSREALTGRSVCGKHECESLGGQM